MNKKLVAYVVFCAFLFALLSGCGGDAGEDAKSGEQSESLAAELTEGRTLLIYMCGSNLESRQGLASKNIDELLDASKGSGLNIVLQTGGAKIWRHHGISAKEGQRYEIREGKLKLLENLGPTNMGDARTLTDFLKWSQESYPTNHNMLILWDHGGGSVKGVCFDENYNLDALTLTELGQALKDAEIRQKYDILGFDACLMASLETAAVAEDYASYMIASEEIVPGGGWDYRSVVKEFAGGGNVEEIGKRICDSFMEKCIINGKELFATLSVLNLAKVGPMLSCLEKAAENLLRIFGVKNYNSQVINAAWQTEKFGIDMVFEESSNMVDFIRFNELVDIRETFAETEKKDFIVYSVNSGSRENSGVSFFFPLSCTEEEVEEYISLGICDRYNEYLSTYFLDVPEESLGFTDRGSITEEGSFRVQLTEDSKKYLSSALYLLIQTDPEGTQHILTVGLDMEHDWEKLMFTSDFRGNVPALSGHRFFSLLHADRETFQDFEAPAIVNGKETYIRYYVTPKEEGSAYEVPGTYDGFDENYLPVNTIVPLKAGDKVQVTTDVSIEEDGEKYNLGEAFTFKEAEITEIPLEGDEYQYVFAMQDNFGRVYFSDAVTFTRQGGKFMATDVHAFDSSGIKSLVIVDPQGG